MPANHVLTNYAERNRIMAERWSTPLPKPSTKAKAARMLSVGVPLSQAERLDCLARILGIPRK